MPKAFDDIVKGGYYVGFGGLTAEQEGCKQFTKDHLDEVLHVRQREKFIKEVRVCCCGYGPADEDEPMEDNNFSQFQFYLPFTHELVSFIDKFDFLVKCVAYGVCKIETGFEERYMQAIIEVLTFRDTTVPAEPHFVLDLRSLETPRTVGEVQRTTEETQLLVERYIKKRDTTSEKLRLELEELEKEQFQVEKDRGEHQSLMGWSDPNSPTSQKGSPSAHADASIERIRADIEIAREECAAAALQEAEERAAAERYVTTGVMPTADDGVETHRPLETATNETMPLLNMLLRIQQEQVRLQQQEAIAQDEKRAVIEADVRGAQEEADALAATA